MINKIKFFENIDLTKYAWFPIAGIILSIIGFITVIGWVIKFFKWVF